MAFTEKTERKLVNELGVLFCFVFWDNRNGHGVGNALAGGGGGVRCEIHFEGAELASPPSTEGPGEGLGSLLTVHLLILKDSDEALRSSAAQCLCFSDGVL